MRDIIADLRMRACQSHSSHIQWQKSYSNEFHLLYAGGRWRLYYSGKDKGESLWQHIGLAITDIDNSETFEGVQIGLKRISSN